MAHGKRVILLVPIPVPILPAEPGLSCDARSQQGWPRAQTRRQPAPSEIPASHIPEQLMEEFSPLLAANELDPSFNSLCVDWVLGPFVFPAWLSSSGAFFFIFYFCDGGRIHQKHPINIAAGKSSVWPRAGAAPWVRAGRAGAEGFRSPVKNQRRPLL